MTYSKLSRREFHVVSAVTFGNILEWYQAYSYVYLTPALSKKFFNSSDPETNLFFTFMIFGIGFLTRPMGGIIFGRWGDLLGRKSAFISSILVMTVPTFLMGCLPTYSEWGGWATFSLILLRLIQSLPESGEAPGSFCYLYENASPSKKVFMTSWGAFGNQIGAIIGVIESLFLDKFMSDDFFLSWGWRISFWIGSAIGLTGFFLRNTLDETPTFKELKSYHKIDKENILELVSSNKQKILLGTAYGIINAVTFYLIAAYLPSYFNQQLGLGVYGNGIISLSILILTTVLLPVFGAFGNKLCPHSRTYLRVKPMMIWSAVSIILLCFPLYYFIDKKQVMMTFIITYLCIIPITCISSLIPFILLKLFPAPVRFTGVGLTFNLADGLAGGFTPAIAILLARYQDNQGAFCWFILVCGIVSLISYFKIK